MEEKQNEQIRATKTVSVVNPNSVSVCYDRIIRWYKGASRVTKRYEYENTTWHGLAFQSCRQRPG